VGTRCTDWPILMTGQDLWLLQSQVDTDEEALAGASLQEARASRGSQLRRAAVAATAVLAVVAVVYFRRGRVLRFQDSSLSDIQAKYQGLDKWLYDGHFDTGGAAMSAEVPQAPEENMHDGNKCGDDEEFFDGLCYAKCSLLTQGSHPIRVTSFSCCVSHPCDFSNTLVNLKPCSHYDVAGDINGEQGACPHPLGTCLQDEELLLGMCYKQCEILTGGEYVHRVAATTCCSTTGLGCLNPANLKTDFVNFPVGGGKGDGNKETPSLIHEPLESLTEKS